MVRVFFFCKVNAFFSWTLLGCTRYIALFNTHFDIYGITR
jgi:hypothetical protein